MSPTPRLPAVFLGHGSPMNALEKNPYTTAWQGIADSMPTPQAILCISAHWTGRGTAVTAMEKPRTIHDFGGFPPELFAVQYPAAGDPALALRVRELLAPVEVRLDQDWGLDHGTWSVLMHPFPRADVPVVQLSLDATLSAAAHYALAKKLNALRAEGVLIVGSGNVVHNLGRLRWDGDSRPYDWAIRFNDACRRQLFHPDHGPLIEYASLVPEARLSVPTPEHYLPFLYVLALQQQDETARVLTDGIELGSISMLSVQLSA